MISGIAAVALTNSPFRPRLTIKRRFSSSRIDLITSGWLTEKRSAIHRVVGSLESAGSRPERISRSRYFTIASVVHSFPVWMDVIGSACLFPVLITFDK